MSDNTVSQSSQQIPKTPKQPANNALDNSVETLGLAKIQPHLLNGAQKKLVPILGGILEKATVEAQTRPTARQP